MGSGGANLEQVQGRLLLVQRPDDLLADDLHDATEVPRRGAHLLPGFVDQLDADTVELLERVVRSEEDWVIFLTCFGSCHEREDNDYLNYG